MSEQDQTTDAPVDEVPAAEPVADPPAEEAPAEEKKEAAVPPQITTASQWRRNTRSRYRITLPTNATVIARRVDATELIVEGLLNLDEFREIGLGGMGKENIPNRIEVARRCCTRIVVQPAVVMKNGVAPSPDQDVIVADEIPALDAMVLLGWSLGLTSGGLQFDAQELPND